ncbi:MULTISPECIES: hypothetical protein [unclassified Mesorhizobium]|uniref:hypothetical protein n=1 Tax=unclassified Mesorhizobium TaxID=325217 RepID=UPI0012EC90D7|nr:MULTISPECIES: hypothetical protein [unclassified Mesorhizobium]WJI52985.1 hypothetical protein NLY44_10105 [Mesorhizobium sp. C089B]
MKKFLALALALTVATPAAAAFTSFRAPVFRAPAVRVAPRVTPSYRPSYRPAPRPSSPMPYVAPLVLAPLLFHHNGQQQTHQKVYPNEGTPKDDSIAPIVVIFIGLIIFMFLCLAIIA